MQLQLDWSRRDRCAQMIDQSLLEIGVCGSQRAAALLVFVHPRSTLVDRENQISSLRISYRQAVAWLRRNSELYRNFELHASSLHDAVVQWSRRGVMHSEPGRPSTLLLHGARLREWHAEVHFDPAEFAREWTHQNSHVCMRLASSGNVQGCSGPYQSLERVSEGNSLSTESENHSLTHSDGARATGRLPELPVEVWDRGCGEQRLYGVLGEWWRSEGLKDRGFDPDAVLGAILAARHNNATAPQGYVQSCLASGVRRDWINRAAAVRRRCKQMQPDRSVVPMAERKKPARVIGPGRDE